MKGYGFYFGVAFGYLSSWLLDNIEWPLWISIIVFLALFFIAQQVAYKIATS